VQAEIAHRENGSMRSPVILEGGLRLKGVKKASQPGKPLVTIITATFNASDYLPRTIESIRGLTYENIEWIIVDGGSKDGTVELIRQNQDIVDYWISEPDGGIYDAWNTGISIASGDWVAFVGAGDSYNPDAIDVYMRAISASSVKLEFASSRVQFVDNSGLVLRVWGAPFKWKTFKKYMTVAHVGALHHRSLFKKHGVFNTSYSSASDYEFLMRCGADLRTIYLDVVTANMLVGGISNNYKSIYETYLIQRKYGADIFSTKFRFWFASVKRFIRPLLRGR
jgi:glycosyltransferase involved in cell wall biosynthesis